MQSIEAMLNNEIRPEVLREMVFLILQNNEVLSLRYQELLAKKALEEKQKQEWINASIKAKLHKLTIRMFGCGREGLNFKPRARRTDTDQLLLHAQSLGGTPHEDEKLDLPKEDCIHTSSIDDIFKMVQDIDPSLSMESAGIEVVNNFFETSTEITITERTYKKIIHLDVTQSLGFILGFVFSHFKKVRIEGEAV